MKNHGMILFVSILVFLGPGLSVHAFDVGPVEIHGFASQGYLKSTGNDYLSVPTEKGSFEYNEVGVNFSTNITEKLRLGIQLISRDLGDTGNNEVKLDWAVADYKWRDELGLRFGKVKRPMGLYNEGRDVDMLRTFVLLPQGIYNEGLRDFQNSSEGFGIYGSITAGALGSFDYQSVLGAPSMEASDNKEVKLITALVPGLDLDDVDLTTYYASDSQIIWNTPLTGLRLGGTISFSKNKIEAPLPYTLPDGSTTLDLELKEQGSYTLSVEYQWSGLTLAAEYQLMPVKAELNIEGLPFDSMKSESYYASASYRFTDWLEAGAYYSVYYVMRGDDEGEFVEYLGYPDYAGWQKEAVVTLRIDLNPNWILKLEGHRINGVGQVFENTDIDDLEEDWSLFAVKTTVSF